jgi:hypothetical protein
MELRARDRLAHHAASALFWIASFAFAVSFFLAATKLLRGIPPTEPVAIGRVTADGVSKARDYAGAALYYALVPLLTILFRARLLPRYHERIAPARGGATAVLSAALFALPFILAPFLFLTTRKELWGLLLPLVLCAAGPLAIRAAERRRWIREIVTPDSLAIHALLLTEGAAWVLFRYLAVGTRIGHIPTLFLEIPFALFFVLLFWGIALLVSRAWSLASFGPIRRDATAIAIAASPLLLLPLLALGSFDLRTSATICWTVSVVVMVALLARGGIAAHAHRIRAAVAWIAIPVLLFVVAWASTANSLKWTDLFHRGESLGPAAEYLAGEVPYRDVFVLHGMLDDGMADAWVMGLFGVDVAIANARIVALSALALVVLWMVAVLLFDSLPLSLLVVALGAMTFVENARSLFVVGVLGLLYAALRRGSRVAAVAAGALSAVTLFYSLDIGIYAIGGSIGGTIALAIWERHAARRDHDAAARPRQSIRSLLLYVAGLAAGAAPFLIWLGSRGALQEFFRVTFVDVPATIDAAWSLPYPDLAAFFRSGLQIRGIADFLLGEPSRFLLNPLVIGVALVALLARFLRRAGPEAIDVGLLLLTAFGLLAQRSALGRADFPHQYFSAFLIAPLLVALFVLTWRSVARVWRGEATGGRLLLVALGLALLPLAGGVLWVPDLLAARLDAIVHYRAQRSPLWYDPAAATIDDRIEAVSSEVRRLTRSRDPIFDFSNQPAFYFFSGRRNPTRFFQIPIASPRRFQAEIIADLEKARPPLVLRRSPQSFDSFDGISNEMRAPAVAAYIDALYEHERTVRGVEIWLRKPGAATPSSARLRSRRPDARAVSPPERAVIPAVASARGAAGASWVSDLVAQNPGDRPLELRLRYASNRGSRDRVLALAPGQLRTVRDFPRRLFGFPDSAGALWLEYPSAQKPIVFALTRDEARDGAWSRNEPLTPRDAADAGTSLSELRVVGARGGGTRRVNLGVVNSGIAPAHVRIYATGESGAPRGGALELRVPEEESRLVVDVEGQLGVGLDGTVTLHVTMLRGRGVAYASVVDGLTGIHELVPALPVATP